MPPKKNTKKREKAKYCLICNKDKKSPKKVKCCSPDMTTKDKASWNI